MPATRIGIREFREKLATHVLQAEGPVAITRHGDTVGYFFPARPKRTEAGWEAFKEARGKVRQEMLEKGVSEDEILADLSKLRMGLTL